MSDIYIDSEKYRNAANILRRLSNELGDARVSLTALMGFVGDSWQGEASDVFLETNEWTIKEIERLRFEMEDLALEIANAVR